MAITSMLVMYTLNQSVSSKLPATAYMKLIDVWLLFGLLLPFVIIILLILMEQFSSRSSSGENQLRCLCKERESRTKD